MLKVILNGIKTFLSLAVFVIFAEIVYEVFSRYVMKQAVPWGAELTQTLLVWVTFIGAASAFDKGQHMVIDILVRSIPAPSARKIAVGCANFAVFVFLALGAWSGFEVVARTWRDTTVSLEISGGIIYLAFPVSMILMLLIFISKRRSGE